MLTTRIPGNCGITHPIFFLCLILFKGFYLQNRRDLIHSAFWREYFVLGSKTEYVYIYIVSTN